MTVPIRVCARPMRWSRRGAAPTATTRSGNQVRRTDAAGTTSLSYDAENRLVGGLGERMLTTTFAYYGDGNLVSARMPQAAPTWGRTTS